MQTMENESITGYKPMTAEDVKRRIAENGIEMIRLEFSDLHGISRGKTLPADMVDTIFESGIPFCSAIMAQCFDNEIAKAKGLTEHNYDDMLVIPDPNTFVILPHIEKTALLLGNLFYHGKPMKQSPRGFLIKMIEEYRALGYNPIAAGEVEFFLFKKNEKGPYPLYTDKVNNCYTDNMRVDPMGFLYKLTRTFKHMGFKILYMNHEYYPGQYEYNWKHGPALRNADETFLFKSISKDLAEQEDLFVTFMAKPKNNNGGSGCHIHMSVSCLETGKDLFYDETKEDGMSDLMKHFVAGVLKHARALTALLAPTVNCYKRYVPDSFAPCYIGWGHDNRTTFIRIPEDRGRATRVEVRAGSAATNPYLAFGSILAAGLDGIKNNLEPPEIIVSDLYHDVDRQESFVPRSLYRAIEELKKDEWLCQYLGEELVDDFASMKIREVETYTNMVTDWEWDTYSYHI